MSKYFNLISYSFFLNRSEMIQIGSYTENSSKFFAPILPSRFEHETIHQLGFNAISARSGRRHEDDIHFVHDIKGPVDWKSTKDALAEFAN